MSGPSRWERFWHAEVPAVRLATFRTLVAAHTLTLHQPLLRRQLESLERHSFHEPFVAGLPHPPLLGLLPELAALAALGLLLGVAARSCALLLGVLSAWVLLLDRAFYHHNLWLHALLLLLLAVAPGRVRLWQLVSGSARRQLTVAWPERLVRVQLAIVFGFAALHKLVSPEWRLSGARLVALAEESSRVRLLAPLETANDALLTAAPGALSAGVFVLEAWLALAFLRPRPWWLAVLAATGFALYVDFLVRPDLFPWDVAAAALLLAPAGDASLALRGDPDCTRCRRRRRLAGALDWLGRIGFEAAPHATACGAVEARDGARVLRGAGAWRRLALGAVAPAFLLVWLAGGAARRWRLPGFSSADATLVAALLVLLALASDALARWRARS